ncbi:MAG TPA: CBASS cGAMP-activated phospholipase [Gemmatimonadaceae bacterium]
MRILSVDGGGYLGLAIASFLQAVEQRFGTTAAAPFDLFCGTSTGAIIALALAAEKTATEVVGLYEQLGPSVFTPPDPKASRFKRAKEFCRRVKEARYDNEPLRAALDGVFGPLTLGDLRLAGKRVLITAFSVSTGGPRIFKTDHAPELVLHDRYRLTDVALASSAAPTYLPLVEIVDPVSGILERFCDGGVVTNSPALLGYAEAISTLECQPADVGILSLGTPRNDLAERPTALAPAQIPLNRGFQGWKFGEQIISITMDGGSKVSHFALDRIAKAAGACYVRVDMTAPPGVGLDIATPEATLALRQLGTHCGRDTQTLARVAPFFTREEVR